MLVDVNRTPPVDDLVHTPSMASHKTYPLSSITVPSDIQNGVLLLTDDIRKLIEALETVKSKPTWPIS
jgi:hypothetical protein